jgi:PAS domain S-box-containing protein
MLENLAPRQIERSTLRGYGIALVATLFAEFMASLTASYFPPSPFVLFAFAVVVSSWFGGRGPGLLAAALGTAATAYLSLARVGPPGTLLIDDLLWLVMSVLVILLINSLITIRQQGQETLLRLAAIVESSDDAIVGQDLAGAITSWNSGAEKIYGHTAAEVKGRSISMLFPPELRAGFVSSLERVRRGEHLRFESQHLQKDGQRIAVSVVLSPITDARKKVTGISMIARDITDSKRAQAEREKLLASEQAARAEAEATSQRLKSVQTITDTALAHLALDDLLRELLNRLRTLLSGDIATILLLAEDKQHFAVRASSLDEQWEESLQVLAEASAAARIVATNAPLVVKDLAAEGPIPLLGQQTGSMIGVPLRVEDHVIGVLHVGTLRQHPFSEEDVQLLQVVADRVALAIDRARLFDQVSLGAERLKRLSQRLMETQELERRSLARELHDQIGQALTAMKINLQTVRRGLVSLASRVRALEATPQSAVDARHGAEAEALSFVLSTLTLLDECIALIERTLQQVRDLSLDLRPSVLDDLGLVSALRWYVDRIAQRVHFSGEFVADALDERAAPEVEIACFRVAQEALTNITRHAQADHVQVELRRLDQAIQLIVRDDGVGFDVRAARARAVGGKSLGLLGMEERVLAVGGRLEINSQPLGGAEIRAYFPYVSS